MLIVATSGFLACIAFVFALTFLYKQQARAEISSYLAGGVQSVSVDGRPLVSWDKLIAQIADAQNIVGHHSHPNKMLQVRLTKSKETLDLVLGRDSDDPHEYWLFYPRYFATNSNDVGHVFTDQLDGF